MLYEETEKKEIERVYAVFADYIRESPYLEWLWSDKLGYLLLKISTKKRYVEEEILVDTADQLAEVLFSEPRRCAGVCVPYYTLYYIVQLPPTPIAT